MEMDIIMTDIGKDRIDPKDKLLLHGTKVADQE